ncbi:MAG: hypothetical protein WD894_12850 [Pirellulales bacterium]
MNLTAEQVQAVQKGEPVRLSDPLLGDYVVVRADVFQALAYDDGALSNNERGYLFREFGRRAGWDDPELDVYEEYRDSP